MTMWHSYRHLISIAYPERIVPMNEEEAQETSKDINLLYMHLQGVLDNFAWCVIYEKFPEQSTIEPIKVGLFKNALKRMLENLEIGEEINEHAEWNKDIKDRRDPVAHRIPLAVPPAILTPDQSTIMQKLQEEWNDLMQKSITSARERRFDDAEGIKRDMDILRDRMNTIGTFFPFFIHHPDQETIPIYPTIPNDMAHLVKLAAIIRTAIKPPAVVP
ncbi:MAG: hypothetical protein U1E17_03330 [Geminicoccaceae bacterium]